MGVEAGRQHQNVELVQTPVLGTHAVGLDALDGFGHQFGVGLLNRRIERVRHDQPLAGHLVVGRQLAAQFGIADVALQVLAAGVLDALQLLVVADHRAREAIDETLAQMQVGLAQEIGLLGEHPLLVFAEGRIGHAKDPLRGALEQRDLRHLVDDRRHDLYRGRAGADDADALAVEAVRMIPARGVEAGAGETLQPVDLRVRWMVQHAGGRDDEIDDVGMAVLGAQMPFAVAVFSQIHLAVEADEALDVVLARHMLEIVLDLAAG